MVGNNRVGAGRFLMQADTEEGCVDTEAFERCWHDHVRRVAAYAERHVGRDSSYDVVSGTFLAAWRTWEEVPDPALPWLIAAAHGQIRNHLRSLRRQRGLQERIMLLDRSAYAGPDAAVTANERSEALALLAAFPEGDRESLLLVAWEGLTYGEAAQVLGCSPATFRVRLHRARQRLGLPTDPTVRPVLRSAP